MKPDPSTLRSTVEAADTYQAAARSLGMPYQDLYRAARKLGAVPRLVAARKARPRAVLALPAQPAPPRAPAPEAAPPTLSQWIYLRSGPVIVRSNVVAIRIDEAGRTRAEVRDLGDECMGWVIRDVTGQMVGKVGLRIGLWEGQAIEEAKAGADEALIELGWLPNTCPRVNHEPAGRQESSRPSPLGRGSLPIHSETPRPCRAEAPLLPKGGE